MAWHGMAWQGRAGQGRAGQGRAGLGRAGQGRTAGRPFVCECVCGPCLPCEDVREAKFQLCVTVYLLFCWCLCVAGEADAGVCGGLV